MTQEQKDLTKRLSIGRTISAVAWSFLGVRANAEHAEDMKRLNPFYVILVGIVACLLLVVGLMVLVKFVVLQ